MRDQLGVGLGGVDDADARRPPGQALGQGDAEGSRGLHADPGSAVAETLQPGCEGGEALRVVVELFVAVLAFAEAGHIEFAFGDIQADGDLGHDDTLQGRFIRTRSSGPNARFRLMVIQARPLAGAYAYRSNCKGECGKWGAESTPQARSLRVNQLPLSLPMISRGFCPLAEDGIEI